MSDVNHSIRLEGLSRRIGRSTVFAKPSRHQPSAPPSDGVRPRRVAAKTGPPALPLRHQPQRPHRRILISARSAGPSRRAPAFSEVRPGARAHTRRQRSSPLAGIGAASPFPCFSNCKVPAGLGTASAWRSLLAAAAATMAALGRSDASWMADSSLRCGGCSAATREQRGRAAAWSSSRAARTTEWLRRWGVLRR